MYSIVFTFHHFVPEINGKGEVNVGCGPKNLSLDSSVGYSWGTTLDSTQSLSATALQFSSTGNSRFYKCNTDGCNGESPTKYYKTTIEGYFLLIVGSFGALGNVLTMLVLTRPSMRSNVNLIFAGKSNSANLVITYCHTSGFSPFNFDLSNFFYSFSRLLHRRGTQCPARE